MLNKGAQEAASSPRSSHTRIQAWSDPSSPTRAHQTPMGCPEAPVLSGASQGLFQDQGLGPNTATHTAEAHPWSQALGHIATVSNCRPSSSSCAASFLAIDPFTPVFAK